MRTKKSDHKHIYEKVLAHITDKNSNWLNTSLYAERCVVCGRFKELHFFETEVTMCGHFHRMLNKKEVLEKYKHLPQVYVTSKQLLNKEQTGR